MGDEYNNIYISAALNREPGHFDMLAELGLEAEYVHRASAHETIYQAVMRTSLRVPELTTKVHAIVPDEPSARRLAEFTGATDVGQIGALGPGPRIAFNDSDKKRRQAAKRVLEARNVPNIPPTPYINGHGVKTGTLLDFNWLLDGPLKDANESVGFASGWLTPFANPLASSSVNQTESRH